MTWRGLLAGIGACAALAAPAAANGATRFVDDDGVQCPDAAFASVQAAIDASAPVGDVVRVCPGTYRQRLVIAKRVRVIGTPARQAVVIGERGPFAGNTPDGIIEVASSGVVLQGLDIRGPAGPSGCMPAEPLDALVLIRRGRTRINDSRLSGLEEQECGRLAPSYGIQLGLPSGPTEKVSGDIYDNELELGGPGSSVGGIGVYSGEVGINGNTIRALAAHHAGIDLRGFSTGGMRDNDVSGWITGISLGGHTDVPGRVLVSGNRVFGNAVGLTGLGRRDFIFRNRITGNGDGISYGGVRSTLSHNTVSGNRGRGILIAGPDAGGNTLIRNDFRGNGGFDCEDRTAGADARTGTANRWYANRGLDDTPPAICVP